MKTVAIIGAGPAGLSMAFELLRQSNEYCVTIFEKESEIGGLSKTFEFEGGRVDIGGHRFFTKNESVQELWETVLPIADQGMLVRNRKSHILWKSKLIEYPVQLNLQTIRALGVIKGVKVVTSYLISMHKNNHINTLEDFYVQRFGRELYSTFFENYTYKLWGIPANQLSSDWGEQRVQKVSLAGLVRSMIFEQGKRSSEERSLIKEFYYPSFGSGQLWNELWNKILALGGKLETDCTVDGFELNGTGISSIEYTRNNVKHKKGFDYVISSMPLKDLVSSLDNCPDEIRQIANRLLYRDMIIVAVEIAKSETGFSFQIAEKDCWLYMQDEKMSFGRVQILNNWSPYAAASKDSILLELEFFCDKDDEMWRTDDRELLKKSISELVLCGLCKDSAKAVSYFIKRIEKAYPIYTDGYYQLDIVEEWINRIDNLRCIGRNGQHRYNNMDHSVETGIEAAKSILNENYDRKWLWNVNKKQEYLEQ